MLRLKGRNGIAHGPAAAIALSLAVATAGAGCAANSAVRRAAPYPGMGQTEEQRTTDMAECEAWATQEAERTDPHDTAEKVLAGALIGGAVLAGTGAVALAILGCHGAGAGAAAGAAVGAINGAMSSGVSSAVADRQVVAAGWHNCMIARGYVVDGTGGAPLATNNVGNLGGQVGAISGLQ
jgi:hypothetical protein